MNPHIVTHADLSNSTRRDVLRGLAFTPLLLSLGCQNPGESTAPGLNSTDHSRAQADSAPWYQKAVRWGQTNIVEIDPQRYDIEWWREFWRYTHLQGVVINGGGILSYYPTKIPYHRQSNFLNGRDLFGELVRAAHEDGLAVLARMDANRADREFYEARPDWFARDINGEPYMRTGLYIACVNSPYYDEHIPAILTEIASQYGVEGFADNNWNGPMRHQPCYCGYCANSFKARTGEQIPREADWNNPLYREWILWNYDRRLEIWDMFNAVSMAAGGPDCIWVGMMAGSQNWQARVFRDDREVYRRAKLIMLDDQRRFDHDGFMHNAEIGKRLRSVGGWDKIIPESMAMYNLTEQNFRHAAKPVPEVHTWMIEGYAGGVQPWWHMVGADQQDRRMFETAKPLMDWHKDNEAYLLNRRPVASIGLLWSQRNMDFFGRELGYAHVDEPWNGFGQALVRDRIPYVPVHIDDIARETDNMNVLVMPNLGAVSDSQIAAIRQFVEKGGNLVATGASSLLDEWGDVREDFALGDLFGVSLPKDHDLRKEVKRDEWATAWQHTYLRLHPELRATHYGPVSDAPDIRGQRHAVLDGFAKTDILAFGGTLQALDIDENALVPLTYVPHSPNSPAEDVYMREPVTNIPGLVLNILPQGNRIAYLPADIDRQFSKKNLPDHADLLANIIRWAAGDSIPLKVEGKGLVDCNLYEQPDRLVIHLANLTSAGTWRSPVHEFIPIGPLQLKIRLLPDMKSARVQSLVSNKRINSKIKNGWIAFELPVIIDHEVLVIG